MENKVVLDFTAGVKEVVLGPSSRVAGIIRDLRGHSAFVINKDVPQRILSEIETYRNSDTYTPLMKQLEIALRNPKENDDFFKQMNFLVSVSDIIHATYYTRNESNTNTLQSLLMRFHDIKDAQVSYKMAQLLRGYAEKVWGRENPMTRQIITLVANQSLATSHDIAVLFRISPKNQRADVFAKLEKYARREIRTALESTVPDISCVKGIIKRVYVCAGELYGIPSAGYTKICQDYSEEKLLTPSGAKYISAMPDAVMRQVAKLEQDNATLRAENDKLKLEAAQKNSDSSREKSVLESKNAKLQQQINLYEEQIATLLYAIERTRPSIFSRGVKAAKSKSELVKQALNVKTK